MAYKSSSNSLTGLGDSGYSHTNLTQSTRYGNVTPDMLSEVGVPSVGGAALSGMGTGASIGSSFGGWGTLAGAVVGLGAGIITGQDKNSDARKHNARALKYRNLMREEQDMFNRNEATMNQRLNMPVYGNDVEGFYALGGSPMGDRLDFLAEGGEVVQDSPMNRTRAVDGGTERLSGDAAMIHGPSHESAQGGVHMKGGERVFSDRMKIPKDQMKKFIIR